MKRKFLSAAAKTEGVDERQVRVVVSTGDVDRAGDIVTPGGVDLTAYKANPVVLWNHDQNAAVARCIDIGVVGNAIEALVQFPPAGDDAEADKLYARIKNGVVNAASIGFNPTKAEPIKGGGFRFVESELLEFSFVAVPANAKASIVERNTAKAFAPKVKGLYDVANLAYLLSELGYVADCAEWEAEYEGDDSPVPGMIVDAARQLGEALVAMTVEEVAEMLARLDGGEKGAAIGKIKTFAGILKAGRVLSAANETDIKAACDLMAGASEKLAGVLDQVSAVEADGNEQKSATGLRRRKAIIAHLALAS